MEHAIPLPYAVAPLRGRLLQPEDIRKPLSFAVAGDHRHAVLILDAYSVIRFATTRSMFGWTDEELPDSPLRSLIPTLPVRQSTPGYNVAYVRLNFANQAWRPYWGVASDGSEFPVEVSLRPLSIGRSYALLAAVREAGARHHARRSPRHSGQATAHAA